MILSSLPQGLVPFLNNDKDIQTQKKSLTVLAETMFDKFDTDEDGKLTKQDFITGCKEESRILEILDTCMTLALVAPSTIK